MSPARAWWPPSWWPFPRPQPPTPPDPPPPTYTVRVEVFEGDPADDEKIPGAEVVLGDHPPLLADGAGNAHVPDVLSGTYPLVVSAASFSTVGVSVTVPTPRPVQISLDRVLPPWVPLDPLTTDQKIFRHRGQPWRYIGATAFNFVDQFAKGWDPAPFLAAYAGTAPGGAGGITIIRSFCYTPVKDWGADAWGWPSASEVLNALSLLEARGLRMELVLLTDDDPANIPIASALVRLLAIAQPKNLLVEIANEPDTHKAINTQALRSALDQSGFLYSSGNYEDSRKWFGRYYTCHTARTSDWPRRAHDLLEFYDGTGPDQATTPHRVPCVGDEPGKVQDVGAVLKDWRAYFGGCSLMGAGGTIHLETGKLCQVPTPTEQPCIQAALDGLYAFPADAPFGAYRRIVEPGNEPGGPTQNSRTYVVGSYAVRSQQIGNRFPEPGWVSLDPDGVLWRKA